jgi:hypothetical protein
LYYEENVSHKHRRSVTVEVEEIQFY